MGLIANLSIIFSPTFGNLDGGPGPELRDMDRALATAINDHISRPLANKAFNPIGFGTTWKNSYTQAGLPTSVLVSHADYIDGFIRPILADAIAININSLAALMNAAPPPIAQASAAIISEVLGSIPGGLPIATTMNSGISAAIAVPAGAGLATIPSIVSAALTGLSALVTSFRLAPESAAARAADLDFRLSTISLAGATSARPAAWRAVSGQVAIIPINPVLAGPLGANFWTALLFTIVQASPV